jgi:hypothetical protein
MEPPTRKSRSSWLRGPWPESRVPGAGPAEGWNGSNEPFRRFLRCVAAEGPTGVGYDAISSDLVPLVYFDFNEAADDVVNDQSGNGITGSCRATPPCRSGGANRAVISPDGGGRTGSLGDRCVDFGERGAATGPLVRSSRTPRGRGSIRAPSRGRHYESACGLSAAPISPPDDVILLGIHRSRTAPVPDFPQCPHPVVPTVSFTGTRPVACDGDAARLLVRSPPTPTRMERAHGITTSSSKGVTVVGGGRGGAIKRSTSTAELFLRSGEHRQSDADSRPLHRVRSQLRRMGITGGKVDDFVIMGPGPAGEPDSER